MKDLPDPLPTDAGRARAASPPSTLREVTDADRLLWVTRILAVIACGLAVTYARVEHSLAAVAFGVLGFGFGIILEIICPERQEWLAVAVNTLCGLAILGALSYLLGFQ